MKYKIIYLYRTLIFKQIIFAVLLLMLFCSLTNAQPGAIDPSFDPGAGANTDVQTIAIQSDGKIMIGGNFLSYNGTPRMRIARLNSDGTLDTDFDPGSGANDIIWTIAIQSDGKIIIGGQFDSYNGVAKNHIARLNVNGTLDNTFNPGTGASSNIFSITIQSDGKIIIGGYFTTYNGSPRNGIARLNTNGTLDNTFDPGTGANDGVNKTIIQNDGKIIIVGGFTSYNGNPRSHIARLNTNGTLDAGFNPGTGTNLLINAVALQNDGKMIIGGYFTSYNGNPINYIARLNTDGTLDAGFNTGSGPSDVVFSIAAQSDGKIIIGGNFTAYQGTPRKLIARLNANGTLDTDFDPGSGTNGTPLSIVLQNDGKIIIAGLFTLYNGTGRNRVARILGGNDGISSIQPKTISIFPNPVSNELNIEIEGNNKQENFEILNLLGEIVFKGILFDKTTVQIADYAPGVYLVKLGNEKGFDIKKIIKE